MNKTAIEWTDFTSNPVKYRNRETGQIVWACVKHSPGCAHCYAESLALRYGRGGPYTNAAMAKVVPFIDDTELRKIITAKTVGGVQVSGSRVFIGDMTDVFGSWVTDEMIDRMFAAFAHRPDVTFQVLTKRADRMTEYVTEMRDGGNHEGRLRTSGVRPMPPFEHDIPWPLPNVWIGTSVENQAAADERIPHLLRAPAAVRFLSCEPLLGEVILHKYLAQCQCGHGHGFTACPNTGGVAQTCHLCDCRQLRPLLGWGIVGGESGHDARNCRVEWMRSLVKQCKAAAVPVFVKQDSGKKPGQQGRIPLEIWQHKEFPSGN